MLLFGYLGSGTLTSDLLFYSALLIVPSIAGFSVGEQIRQRLSAERFRRALLWFFFIMGLNLIRRSVF